jgi:hypothetical protein
MAFYGNFEGTLKSTILIGKGGTKLNSQDQKLNIQNSSGSLTNARVADAVELNDAVNYKQFSSLINSLGTSSTHDVSFFASAAQGLKADTALQSGNNISLLTNDSGYLIKSQTDAYYASSLQGSKADTALQSGNNISLLVNNLGYLVKSQTDTYYATSAQGLKADTALQSGNNISLLTNDRLYLVKSVSDTYYSALTHSHTLLDTSTTSNTPSTLVLRDSSGNTSVNITGNASTASKLQVSRNISISGDINAVIPFDGSMDLNITGTFSNSGVVAGTYNSNSGYYPFTIDSKGRITSVGSLIPISSAWSSITSTPTTISGYGITDAVNSNLLGIANGIATLDSTAKIPASQLPSYVDDVLEFTNLSSFPVTGETGKIYVDLSTNKIYRWSGSVYIVIAASPGTTDAVTEGTTNLYFTTARAQAAAPVQSVQGRTGAVVITASDLSLNNVDNLKQLPYTQSLTVTGDVTSSSTLLNSSTIALTLANTGVTSGTYNNSVTSITPFVVDAKGRITSTGTAVTITPAWSSITSKPTTISGYGITDAQGLNANLTSVSGLSTSTTGLVKFTNGVASLDTSAYLTANQSISVTGDATGSGSTSIALTLAASGVTAGTYNNSVTTHTPLTIDAKGRVTATGTEVTITPAWSSITSKPTTISGYGITDAQGLNANLTSVAGLSTSSTGYILMTNGVASLGTPSGASVISLDANHNYKGTDSELAVNTTGTYNIALGYQSLNANTVAGYNIALGYGALKSNVAGSSSVAIGYQSQYYANNTSTAFTTYNTSVGYQSLMGSTTASANTGTGNTAIGHQSLAANSSGGYNTSIGIFSLQTNTIGANNIAVGYSTMATNVAGTGGIAIGSQAALFTNNSGTTWNNYNVAIGNQALYGSSTASSNTGNSNIAIGYQVLYPMTTGSNNVGIGTQALLSANSANNNTAVGYYTLRATTSGGNNTALGSQVLRVSTGVDNVGVGYSSLYSNIGGSYNLAVGDQSLYNNVAGNNGVALGFQSQYYVNNSSTSWTNYNTSIGYQALQGSGTPANNTGNYNTVVGYTSMYNNTTGSNNVALGFQVLQNNTTGSNNIAIGGSSSNGNNTTGSYNIGIGASTNAMNSTSSYNIGIGHQALYTNTSNSNIGIGYQALYYATGANNVSIGYQSSYNITSGANNTSIGNSSGASVATLVYSTAIGASSVVSTSNTIVLGRTTDVTVIGATGDDSSGNKLQVTGTIGATTPTAGDNSTKVATTAFVSTALGSYVAPNKMSLNTQTGTAYTLALTDYSSALMVEMNNASANTVTIPTNATVAFPVGATIPIRQYGAGQTTIVAASGVTLRNAHATSKIAAQYGSVCLHQRATDEWVIEGYLAAS